MASDVNPDAARSEFESQILTRAIKDSDFRRSLVDDPAGTLQREYGVELPPGTNVKVLEQTPDQHYIVLPPTRDEPGRELSEKEVEAVASGSGWVTTCSGSTSGCDSTCSTCSSCSINCTC